MMEQVKELFKNKNYVNLVFLFTFQFAVYTCLAAILNSITARYDYTSSDASLFGVCFVASGVLGSIFFSIMLDKF